MRLVALLLLTIINLGHAGCSDNRGSSTNTAKMFGIQDDLPLDEAPWGPIQDGLKSRITYLNCYRIDEESIRVECRVRVQNDGSKTRRIVIGPLDGTEMRSNIDIMKSDGTSWSELGAYRYFIDINSENILVVPKSESRDFDFWIQTRSSISDSGQMIKAEFGTVLQSKKYWSGILESGSTELIIESKSQDVAPAE